MHAQRSAEPHGFWVAQRKPTEGPGPPTWYTQILSAPQSPQGDVPVHAPVQVPSMHAWGTHVELGWSGHVAQPAASQSLFVAHVPPVGQVSMPAVQ